MSATVDKQKLRAYYRHIFPWEIIKEKLYCNGMDVGLLHQNDIWDRTCNGKSWGNLYEKILATIPKEIHFGALWRGGQRHLENFVSRKFVIDVDLPDYEFSCGGNYKKFKTLQTATSNPYAKDFQKSWILIQISVQIIDYVLKRNFGFTDCKWISSGNKGVHCWVLDERANQLQSYQRKGIFNFIMHDEGLFNEKHSCTLQAGIYKKSSHLQFCYRTIRPHMETILTDQSLWPEATRQIFGTEQHVSGDKRWYIFERHNHTKAIVFALKVGMPRLDLHATGAGQMAKVPFSVHHKTGKIAVPFDAGRVFTFEPASAPSLDDALDYHDRVSKNLAALPCKHMGNYVAWFAKRGKRVHAVCKTIMKK